MKKGLSYLGHLSHKRNQFHEIFFLTIFLQLEAFQKQNYFQTGRGFGNFSVDFLKCLFAAKEFFTVKLVLDRGIILTFSEFFCILFSNVVRDLSNLGVAPLLFNY